MGGAGMIGMLLRCIQLAMWAAAAFTALFGAFFVAGRRRLQGEEKPFPHRLWLVLTLLVGWAAMVLGLTLIYRVSGGITVSRAGYTGINLKLLRCYVNAWNGHFRSEMPMIVCNVLMFVPLGALLPFLKKEGMGARAACFVSGLATFSVEALQLILRRGFFDVDDMLHNGLGAMLGYFAAVFLLDLVHKKRPDKLLLGRAAAVLLLLAAEAFLGLAACGLQGWDVLPLRPQRLRQTVVSEKTDAILRQAAVEKGAPAPNMVEQAAMPVFAFLFGGQRAVAAGYCNEMLSVFDPPAIRKGARLRFEIQLPVPEVLQRPQLPNGCEVTSLTALLQYRGFAANKLDLAYAYVPRENFSQLRYGRTGPDPELAYAGDPATSTGFYCFAAPLAQGANQYLQEMGSSMHAFDVTGITPEGLEQYIYEGDPVVVWVTLDLSRPRTGSYTWIIRDTGKVYKPYSNLHCVVLIGWGQDTCTLMDPLRGIRTVNQKAFLRCFAQMGSRALVIH